MDEIDMNISYYHQYEMLACNPDIAVEYYALEAEWKKLNAALRDVESKRKALIKNHKLRSGKKPKDYDAFKYKEMVFDIRGLPKPVRVMTTPIKPKAEKCTIDELFSTLRR